MRELQNHLDEQTVSRVFTVYGTREPLTAPDFSENGLSELATGANLITAEQSPQCIDWFESVIVWWNKQPARARGFLDFRSEMSRRENGIGSGSSPMLAENLASIVARNKLYGFLYPVVATSMLDSDLYSLVEGGPKRISGLLELPTGELMIPVANWDTFHRVTLLFNANFIRIYPRGEPEGLIYRVRGKSSNYLLKLLNRGTPVAPVQLLPAPFVN